MGKKISLKHFLELKKKFKKNKKKLVVTNGCYDLIHPGHIRILRESKKIGDVLVVLINSDKSVKKNKGSMRPIQKQKDRVEILTSIKYVDFVIMFDNKTPSSLYKKLLPDVLTKGSEYKKNSIAGAREVISYGGKVKLIKMKKNYSTSKIINKIKKI